MCLSVEERENEAETRGKGFMKKTLPKRWAITLSSVKFCPEIPIIMEVNQK